VVAVAGAQQTAVVVAAAPAGFCQALKRLQLGSTPHLWVWVVGEEQVQLRSQLNVAQTHSFLTLNL
jgi:hypothetical protein